MSSEKKVSIVINCLNGEKYLKQCLESIVNQKYQNFEIIFWDNNSQDKSKEILNEYNDLRIKYYFSNKTEKLSVRRNYMRRLLREILKNQLPYNISFDIVVRVHKAFYKENYKQIEGEVVSLIKALPL